MRVAERPSDQPARPASQHRYGAAETWRRQSVIALWLGHESVETTQVYLHADLKLKEQALNRMAAPALPPGRYRPDDQLLAFLEAL